MKKTDSMIYSEILKENQQLKQRMNEITSYLMVFDQKIGSLGIAMGTLDFTERMITDILVERDILTQEELEKMRIQKVEEPIKEYLEKAREELSNREESKKEKVVEKEEVVVEEKENNNVILASEKFKGKE